MELTETQYELLFEAWTISRAESPLGMVLRPDAYPDAHELAEQGWLERKFVDPAGAMSWHWTTQADQAFAFGTLMNSTDGREN